MAFDNIDYRHIVAAEIRRSIEHTTDGYRKVRFFELRDYFGLRLWSASRKKIVAELLAEHGIACQPPLTEVSLNDWVTLTVRD